MKGGDNMIKIVAKNFVKKENIDEVIKLSKELVDETIKEEGCISYEMYQDVNDNSILTMIETWENRDVLAKHSKSEHFQRIVPMMSTHMEKPAEMNIYTKIL
jgi:quinol monooxygenase YgiN